MTGHPHPQFEHRKAVITERWPDLTVTAGEIGALLGMTKSAVLGMVHRLGLPPRVMGYAPVHVRHARSVKSAATRIAKGTQKPPPPPKVQQAPKPRGPRPLPGAHIPVLRVLDPGLCCHFPLWGADLPPRGQQFYCGRPGYPWCPDHHAIVFNPVARAEAA